MALLLMEGFDHYSTTTTALNKGWNGGYGVNATGRFGGRAATTGFDGYMYKNLPDIAGYSEVICGFAWKQSAQSTNTNNFTLLQLVTTIAGNPGTNTIAISSNHRSPSGDLWFKNNAGTQIGSDIPFLGLNTWNYMEVRCKIGASTGELEVRINGNSTPAFSVTGVNTGANPIKAINLGAYRDSVSPTFDDVYVVDRTGTIANDFLGDVKVETVYPTGAGSSTNFARGGTDSGSNWGQVDENSPNSATDYVTSSTVGHKDLYAMGDLTTAAGTVYGVQVNVTAAKSDAGTRKIVAVAKTGAAESDSSDFVLATGYSTYTRLMTDKPGGTGWTIAEVNSSEFGVKVSG